MFSNLYIDQLPQNVYLSIDIDGLEPLNCPNTGTPVIGIKIWRVRTSNIYDCKKWKKYYRFRFMWSWDSADGWDANVGARVLYQLLWCPTC